MSESIIVRDIDRGVKGEVIRVEVSEYKGKKLLNIRIWYPDPTTGEFKPTQKGLAVSKELYDELKDAILDAGTKF